MSGARGLNCSIDRVTVVDKRGCMLHSSAFPGRQDTTLVIMREI